MVAIARPVGPNRYRESHGRYFEEFTVGDVYEHRPGRTITESDNINFSLLTMNFHPLHCDAAYAAKSEFGRCLVNSGLTIAIVLGMSVADVSAKAIANLGIDKLRLTAPVFPGETIRTEIWRDGTVVSFRAVIPERNIVAMNNGRAEVRT